MDCLGVHSSLAKSSNIISIKSKTGYLWGEERESSGLRQNALGMKFSGGAAMFQLSMWAVVTEVLALMLFIRLYVHLFMYFPAYYIFQ